jgi:hypothetical protein
MVICSSFINKRELHSNNYLIGGTSHHFINRLTDFYKMELHMTAQDLEGLTIVSSTSASNEQDEEYSIPLDISDIINICREFTKLGWQIQAQVENILEVGVEESIKSGNVKRESLPHIKSFLLAICKNPYFGDAISQARDCIILIQDYEEAHKIKSSTNLN